MAGLSPLHNAWGRWMDAEMDYLQDPCAITANAAEEALEALAALAYQNGYEPNGSLGLTEWVVREIAG